MQKKNNFIAYTLLDTWVWKILRVFESIWGWEYFLIMVTLVMVRAFWGVSHYGVCDGKPRITKAIIQNHL